MKIDRRQALLFAALAPFARGGLAQEAPWPTRPIRLVAGGVGSVSDIRARWIAPRLGEALGQPVIVENNGAAGGNLSAAAVARSAPDGYTVLMYHQGLASMNPHLYAKPGYDPLVELQPVTRFGHGALLLAVPTALPAQSVSDLLALARSQPGALNFGSPGVGTPPHLASELFIRMARIDAVHVPYRGGGALMAALLGAQITWAIEGLTSQLPHVQAGRLRALAVTGARRSRALPEVPTMAEAGLPGYEYEGWTGFAVARATPAAIVARLHAEISRLAATAEAREWFAQTGSEAGTMTPVAMDAFVREEHARWGRFIRETGLKAE